MWGMSGGEETVLHAIRDCNVATCLWEALLLSLLLPEFFSLQLKD